MLLFGKLFGAAPGPTEAEVQEMAHRADLTVAKGFKIIWQEKIKVGRADPIRDSLRTGMIGVEYTPLTTTMGVETAKELSTHPGWAGWIVKQLAAKGIYSGARVAVSCTGSFPAMNLAVFAALQELKVKVDAISSVGASSWGANEPGFTWPEMEHILREEGVLKVTSNAITLGGTGDRGAEWSDYAMSLAGEAIKKSSLPVILPHNLRDAVKKRLLFYGDPSDYACFINVGGSQATLGGGARVRFTRGGWYLEPLGLRGEPDGVMDRFLDAGVPCLNLLFLDDLNRREGIVKK